jgi:hypothetical protein
MRKIHCKTGGTFSVWSRKLGPSCSSDRLICVKD